MPEGRTPIHLFIYFYVIYGSVPATFLLKNGTSFGTHFSASIKSSLFSSNSSTYITLYNRYDYRVTIVTPLLFYFSLLTRTCRRPITIVRSPPRRNLLLLSAPTIYDIRDSLLPTCLLAVSNYSLYRTIVTVAAVEVIAYYSLVVILVLLPA